MLRFKSGAPDATKPIEHFLAKGTSKLRCFTSTTKQSEGPKYPHGILSNNHHVFQSPNLQHWFKNWQHLRRNKLTASTFGSAVGFWPRGRIRLWLEKLGMIEPFAGNIATCWSNIKEQEALERYKLLTDNSVSYPNFQVYDTKNPKENWLAASPDGVVASVISANASYGVLEVKCPYFGGDDRSVDFPWKRVPLHYIPQAQGLMEIMDCDWLDFYVWTVNGSSLFRINRNREYWELLKMALSDFWWDHVEPAKEVCNRRVITDPLIELAEFMPSKRHESFHTIIYASKLMADDSGLVMQEIHGRCRGYSGQNRFLHSSF